MNRNILTYNNYFTKAEMVDDLSRNYSTEMRQTLRLGLILLIAICCIVKNLNTFHLLFTLKIFHPESENHLITT